MDSRKVREGISHSFSFFLTRKKFATMSQNIIEWWAEDWGSNHKRGSWASRIQSLGELDSITPNAISTKHLFKSTNFSWAQTALADILEDTRVALMWDREPPRKAHPSDALWRPHIEYLIDKKVLSTDRVEGGIIHWATYFAVEKPGTFKCAQCKAACCDVRCHACELNSAKCCTRAIFNARMWNEASKHGAHCNLVRPDVALTLMTEHSWGDPGKGFFTNSFDIKNFFYQVPISKELSRHLGISCDGLVARCEKLPMGWHRSVITACSLTAAIILCDTPSYLYMKHVENGVSPPAFITVLDAKGETRGWVFHYVDNIFVIVDDSLIHEQWCTHIRKQLKRFNVALKYDRVDNTFLGVEVTTRDSRLHYHHSNVGKWSESFISNSSSRRDVAHTAGVILWDRAVADTPWSHVAHTIEALSRVGREATSRKLWDALHCLPPECVEDLNTNLRRILTDTWYTRRVRPSRRIFACSDASLEKIAFVFLDEKIEDCISFFDRVTNHDHIYLLELEAARFCIEFCANKHPDTELWLAIDNKAVFHAMRRKFSLEAKAAKEFLRIERVLKESNIAVIPVLIRGVDNLADCKTRGKRLSNRRFRRTWEVLRAATEGRRPMENSEEISEGEGESDDEGPQGGEHFPCNSDEDS